MATRMEETAAAIVDSLCLYLSFNFASKLYDVLCCPCHRMLYSCCVHYTFSEYSTDKRCGAQPSIQSLQSSELKFDHENRKSSFTDPSYRRLEL